ncbi:FAD-dependent monooxygenase [Sphingomonas sp. PP-CC-3G-468]|uniref:FAD-dependent monooxygenase n=1 Tax=Sphingomonas sp. PP-CC-3G-468 TaxID=2135656 RepID=UPI001051DE3B|nr:FAD-dependent monooxygenase [Sphingomonas sp. PP-CC-3G-468]TCM00438.1 2-polyprenyl-6-methoxyphenol hydroxylase-like FAD-dependent oxidoreductase [Sphingomonas sp. PP-CC-3G-468]
MTRRILVTGASISGCAVAWWLGRRGFEVTVVEQASTFRDGGQNVDVRGAARDVLRLMKLEDAVRERNTGERGIAWVNDRNKTVAQIDLDGSKGDGPTAELEILRGDLARLLHDEARGHADFRFGDRIVGVDRKEERAHVTFQSGRAEQFDLVVIAEGVGSKTRDLLFPGENHPRWMNLATAFFTIKRAETDSDIARWYNVIGGASAGVRPDNTGTTRAFFNVQGPRRPTPGEGVEDQKAFLRTRFVGAGWEIPRLLAGMADAKDFWFDDLRQVRMQRWSRGPLVLTGDAAWCVTPLGGAGASLALIGAYVLAGELSRTQDIGEALDAYERKLRALVNKTQSIPKLVPRLAHPHSRAGIFALQTVQKIVALPALQRLAIKAVTPAVETFVLPEYSGGSGDLLTIDDLASSPADLSKPSTARLIGWAIVAGGVGLTLGAAILRHRKVSGVHAPGPRLPEQ